ncbi:hypothetical protein ACF0H5_011807 [Mactra antiquata]
MLGSTKFGYLIYISLSYCMLTGINGSSRWNVAYHKSSLDDYIFDGPFFMQESNEIESTLLCILLCQKAVDCMLFGYHQNERKCRIYSSGFYTASKGIVVLGWENYVYGDHICTANGGFVHVRTSNLCIHPSNEKAPFIDARKYCSDRHSKLISLTTTAKSNAFDNIIKTTLKIGSPYIGLSKIEGQWTWEDGNILGSEAQWNDGQPYCSTGDCNCVIKFMSSDYRWGDSRCEIIVPFVCERELNKVPKH